MKQFRELLKERLRDRISEDKLEFLPSGFQRIGNIIIVNLKPELKQFREDIGETVLDCFRDIKTVCNRFDKVRGQTRSPSIEVIAGEGTETVHTENGCFYKIDVAKLMFAKGNVRERGRLPLLVKPGETIVDMFCGLGYFTIPIAKFAKPKKIYAIDINPLAIDFLKENIKLNLVSCVETILGNCRTVSLPEKAGRIIMGYLPRTYEFLPAAVGFLKNNGVIHYHDTFRENELWEKPKKILEEQAQKAGYWLDKISYKTVVKQFAPRVYHVVLDCKFRKAI
jgi:tRNA wybutosine-synthesizing protein 2